MHWNLFYLLVERNRFLWQTHARIWNDDSKDGVCVSFRYVTLAYFLFLIKWHLKPIRFLQTGVTNTDEEFFTAWSSHNFSRKLKLTCGVLLHDFPAVASTFHVQPVGFCRSCDLLTDSSRRLTSELLCKYLNEKALRFKFEVFCGRLFFQNKGSLKTFKCFISRYRFFIRILHEFKFMEVTRLPYTGFSLNN
jgi:hypothetical protein